MNTLFLMFDTRTVSVGMITRLSLSMMEVQTVHKKQPNNLRVSTGLKLL